MDSSGGLALGNRRGQVAEGLMDRIDDAVIGPAAAVIADHPLPQLIVTERYHLRLEIRRDVTRDAASKRGRHGDRARNSRTGIPRFRRTPAAGDEARPERRGPRPW